MKQILFVMFIYFSLSSCNAPKKIYSAPTVNLLHLEKQGDLKLAVNYATVGSLAVNDGKQMSNGGDVQAAYAINNKVGIRVNGYFKRESNQSLTYIRSGVPMESIRYSKKGLEVSTGFYKLKNNTGNEAFNLYAGIGAGKFSFEGTFEDSYSRYSYFHRTNYLDFFIQPSYVVSISRSNLFTVGTRFSLIKYINLQTNHPLIQTLNFKNIDKKPSFFSSFMLQDEFGFKGLNNIKFQCQAGSSILLTTYINENAGIFYKDRYDYNGLWFALGVVADFDKIFSSKP